MTYLEGKTDLCNTKLNITYADVAAGNNSLFALQDIVDALIFGISRASEYKPWPFLEGSGTATASVSSDVYSSLSQYLMPESAFLVSVNGTVWSGEGSGKRNFADYMKWRSDYPTDNSKIWSEYGGDYYINPNALQNGQTITVYGLSMVELPSADGDPLSGFVALTGLDFSGGDQAIIHLAYAYLLASDKKKNPQGAAAEEKIAYALLDTLWLTISERKALKVPQNRPFFNTDDMFAQGNRPNRNNTNIGNFP